MVDSPYRPGFGARPAVFVGREAHLTRARTVLNRLVNTGMPASTAMVLIGPRGLGKTVMLDVIAEQARERGLLAVQVALDDVSDGPQLLAGRLAAAAEEPARAAGRAAWDAVRGRLAQLSIEINAGVVKITSPPAEPGERRKRSASAREHVSGLLVSVAQLAQRGGRHGLVVLFDELQQARHDDLVVITNALQDASRAEGAPLAAFAAGLPDTPERVMRASSFTERFDFRTLQRLTRDEAERALLEPALHVGVTWEPAAASAVLDAAGGSPYLLQLYGDEVWSLADPEPEDSLTIEQARVALEEGRERLHNGMFRGRWARTSEAERRLLLALAQTVDADGVSSSRDYTRAAGRSTPQLSTTRQSLLDKGLIEAAGFGRLRFTTPGFDDFVLRQVLQRDAGSADGSDLT